MNLPELTAEERAAMESLPPHIVERLCEFRDHLDLRDFREMALDVIREVGGDRKFWDEADTCQRNVGSVAILLKRIYRAGVEDAALKAVELCQGRAGVSEKNMSLRNEAAKCGHAIEWMLLETEECPYCEGEGFQYVDFEHPQWMLCQSCAGTGRIKKGNSDGC